MKNRLFNAPRQARVLPSTGGRTSRAAAILVGIALLLAAVAVPAVVRADGWETGGNGCWLVYTQAGEKLCTLAEETHVGDEYISADNQIYEVLSSNAAERTAVARHKGEQEMPDIRYLAEEAAVVVSTAGDGSDLKIAMYSTHSDESYEPSDGTASVESGEGGIYDVDGALKAALEARGIEVVLDETPHVPHDSSAYKRSRQTAVGLLKDSPDALLDIHRDGIPDEGEYEVQLQGEDASRVRLLVGRSNQNSAENKQFALQLKAVADQEYPGLIKDIFIGKGNYNQDLMSNAILLEFGTHTLEKERAVASTEMMANVLANTLRGDVNGAAGGGRQTEGSGAGRGALWLAVVVAVMIAAFALLQTGRGKEAWARVKRGVH